MLFICQTYPYLRIYDPATEEIIQFQAGKLQLDPGDRGFEVVKAEALRNPSIVMLVEAVQCPECGEPFTGKAAGAQLGKHKKEAHFEKWVTDKEAEQVQTREVKGRQPHACDLCPRVQEFGSADELAIHVRAVHLSVDVDDNGNVFDGEGGGGPASAVIAEPSAAK
jgi:hypothetical protein